MLQVELISPKELVMVKPSGHGNEDEQAVRLHSRFLVKSLTLKVLVATIDAQWEGMGDVGSARYEPALLPPCPHARP